MNLPPLGKGREGADALSARSRDGSTRDQGPASTAARPGAHAEMAGALLWQSASLRHGEVAAAPLWRGRRGGEADLGRRPQAANDADHGGHAMRDDPGPRGQNPGGAF